MYSGTSWRQRLSSAKNKEAQNQNWIDKVKIMGDLGYLPLGCKRLRF